MSNSQSTAFNVPVVIDLVQPISINGVEVNTLAMRRPTMLDQIAMRKHSVAQKLLGEEEDLHMYAGLCGVTPQDLLQLDMADYIELGKVYGNFLQRPQKNADAQPNTLQIATTGVPTSSID